MQGRQRAAGRDQHGRARTGGQQAGDLGRGGHVVQHHEQPAGRGQRPVPQGFLVTWTVAERAQELAQDAVRGTVGEVRVELAVREPRGDLVGRPHGQRRLADARLTGDHAHRDPVLPGPRLDQGQLARPSREGDHVRGKLADRRHAHGFRAQDLRLQPPQRLPRLDAQLVHQHAAALLVRGERLGRAARAVQRHHLLLAQTFVQRMFAHPLVQVGDDLDVPPQVQLGLGALDPRGQALLLQLGHDTAQQPGGGEIGQRGAAPQRERLPVALRRAFVAGDVEQLGEPGEVELGRVDRHQVAGRARQQPGSDDLAQLVDVDL